jgi:pyrroloquinoline quinone (PQQ) biosynthesis protein C
LHFETSKKADVYHRQECEVLLDNLSKEDQAKAETAALKTAKYLWNFLSGVAQKQYRKRFKRQPKISFGNILRQTEPQGYLFVLVYRY